MPDPTQDFHRIKRLPPYVFEQVNKLKAQARARGDDVLAERILQALGPSSDPAKLAAALRALAPGPDGKPDPEALARFLNVGPFPDVDRSLLERDGLEILSQLTRRWEESEIIFLPESLNSLGAAAAFAPQLLRNVDRLLNMRSTRDILSV